MQKFPLLPIDDILEEIQVQGRRRGSFFLSNNYLDDVFTLKDLLGLEKNITANLL